MSFQKIKVVGGTSLSLLLFAICGYPAMAQTGSGNQQSTSQMSQTGSTTVNMTVGQPVMGTVASVVGDTVRVRLASGELIDLIISRADSKRLNLQVGTRIVATRANNGNTTVALANNMNSTAMATTSGMNMMSQQGLIRGVIRNIVGDVITLELPDATLRSFTVSKEQRTQLNLQQGMIVSVKSMTSGSNGDVFVEVANGNMASTGMMSGTVRSIVGNALTITMPDGSTRKVLLSREEIDRLNLVPGMNVYVMTNGGTTTVSLVNETQRSANLNTTRPDMVGQTTDSTVIERRTSISQTTTVSPRITQPSNTRVNTTRTRVNNTRTVQNRPARRARW